VSFDKIISRPGFHLKAAVHQINIKIRRKAARKLQRRNIKKIVIPFFSAAIVFVLVCDENFFAMML
jgi:hypothetical protein